MHKNQFLVFGINITDDLESLGIDADIFLDHDMDDNFYTTTKWKIIFKSAEDMNLYKSVGKIKEFSSLKFVVE